MPLPLPPKSFAAGGTPVISIVFLKLWTFVIAAIQGTASMIATSSSKTRPACSLSLAADAISPRSSASGPTICASAMPTMSPVFPFFRAIDSSAWRTARRPSSVTGS